MRTTAWLAIAGWMVVGCGNDAPSSSTQTGAAEGTDAGVIEVDASAPVDAGRDSAGDAARVDAARDAGSSDATPGKSAPQAGVPSWLISPGDSVFFVGNSFFEAGGAVLPEWVEAIGQVTTPTFPIQTGSHLVPGEQRLSWFFDQPESQQAIASKQYDMFVLQGFEWEPVEEPDTFKAAVRDYYNAITANGGRVMLFMTWDFPGATAVYPDFYPRLVSAYDAIGRELNVPVIPVGQIYHDVNADLPAGQQPWFLLNPDQFHQASAGSAVNAYATFMMLTGINPQGVVFPGPNNDNSAELLRYLSDKSWAEVAPRLTD